jgi:type II secretory pathway pseudopilin PulG
MRAHLFRGRGSSARGGFSLVETSLSVGVLSFGFLALSPLLAVSQKTAQRAHTSRDSAQIAQTLIEEAKQGTLPTGTIYLDAQGNSASSAQAAYSAQSTLLPVTGNAALSRLTLQITPLGAPNRSRTYAVVFTAPQ